MKWIRKLFHKEPKNYYFEQELREIDQWLGEMKAKSLMLKYRLTISEAYTISYRWLVLNEPVERRWEPLEYKEW